MIGEIKHSPENNLTPEELKKLRATKKVHPMDATKEEQELKKVKDRKEEGKGEQLDIEA